MALKLAKEVLNSGVSVEYWSIKEVAINLGARKARIVVSGHLNETAKKTELKNELDTIAVHLSGDDFPFKVENLNSQNVYQAAYKKLKSLDVFRDAVDV